MSGEDESADDYQDSLLNPAVLTMIADDLDLRATTLQNETNRLSDNAEKLREMAQELQDTQRN